MPFDASELTIEELETICEPDETLDVKQKLYKDIPQKDYIRGTPSDMYWVSNYKDQNGKQWVVTKWTLDSDETRHTVLTKIATHVTLGRKVLWKQVDNVYYIHVHVRRRYINEQEDLRGIIKVHDVLAEARAKTRKRMRSKYNVAV